MLRHSRSLVMLALVFLLAACGAQETISTGQALGGDPTATATTAAPTTAPATPTAAATATTVATATTSATATTAPSPTVAATATTARTATTAPAAASPTRSASSAAPSAAAQRTPTVPTASGSTMVVTDSDNRCQMIMPAGMTEDSPGSGEFTLADNKGFALLQSIEGVGLDETVEPFIQSFSAIFTNYQETNRVKTADSERVDFTGELTKPLQGTMYFKQFGNVVCNVILIVYADSGVSYEEILGTMIGSLQAVKP